ncbi:MAG: cation diffusion facilitator family transporter [Thermaerobacter sp.]|nr:cation diffusion facilitator family transporter [Thermaerobacter sp.]
MQSDREAKVAGSLTVVGNALLTVLKIGFGLATNAQVLVADGLHNFADLGASLAVAIGVKVAHVPADFEHPYGHQKAESVAQKIVGILLLLAGIEILYQAGQNILRGNAAVPGLAAAYVAAGSIVVKEVLYRYNHHAADRAHSKALAASAVDNRLDAVTSVVALIGIILARLWSPIFDPVLAAVVSLFVIYSGWLLVNRAVADLMDRFDDRALLDSLRGVATGVGGVMEVTGIRGRYMGAEVLIDLEIAVPGEFTVREGHSVATSVKEAIMKSRPEVVAVHVHVNPEEE